MHPLDDIISQILSMDRASCRLVVSLQPFELEAVATSLQARMAWPSLCVGRYLSDSLLELPPKPRPMEIRHRLTEVLMTSAPEPLVCTHIDLLFEPVLRLNPLALFRQLSKVNSLVVLWLGEYDGSILTYAVPDHARYRTWRNPGVAIVPVE
jgi:hypothetical protein